MSFSTSVAAAVTVAARRGSCGSRTPRPSARVADLRPSRRACPAASLLAECASLPPTHARVERERRPRRRSSSDDSEVLVRDIVRKRPHSRGRPPDEQRRSDAADSPGDPQRALPAPGYRDGGTPAPPIRPVRGALRRYRPVSIRRRRPENAFHAPPLARDENAFRQHPIESPTSLSARRSRGRRVGDGRERRVARGPPRTHPLHRRVVSFPRLPRLPDPLRPPRRPQRRRRLLRVALHPRRVAWLWQTLTRARDEEIPLHQNPEPGFDPPSESARASRRGGVASWATLVGPPSSLAVFLGCAAGRDGGDDARDVSAFDATRARHVAERWFVVVPGIVGAAAHAAGTVAGTVARERASGPAGKSGQVPRAESSVVAERFDRRRPRRRPRRRTTTTPHVLDVAIASFARWAQGPLHLLASVVSLDGSWTAATAGNAASLTSAVSAARRPCPRITSCPRASRASNRSDRISSRRAPPRTDQQRGGPERARSPPSPRAFAVNAAHIAAGRYSSRLRSRGSSNYERNVVCDAKKG